VRFIFVIRHKENIQFNPVKENVLPENRNQHILVDEIIELSNPTPKPILYPSKIGYFNSS